MKTTLPFRRCRHNLLTLQKRQQQKKFQNQIPHQQFQQQQQQNPVQQLQEWALLFQHQQQQQFQQQQQQQQGRILKHIKCRTLQRNRDKGCNAATGTEAATHKEGREKMVRTFRVKELLKLLGFKGHKGVVKKIKDRALEVLQLEPAIIINDITSTSDRRHAVISCFMIQLGCPCVL